MPEGGGGPAEAEVEEPAIRHRPDERHRTVREVPGHAEQKGSVGGRRVAEGQAVVEQELGIKAVGDGGAGDRPHPELGRGPGLTGDPSGQLRQSGVA